MTCCFIIFCKNNDFIHWLTSITKNECGSRLEPKDSSFVFEKGDPDMFQIILYTDEPVAYMFPLQYDGHNYFWFPSDTSILSDEIQEFFHDKKPIAKAWGFSTLFISLNDIHFRHMAGSDRTISLQVYAVRLFR